MQANTTKKGILMLEEWEKELIYRMEFEERRTLWVRAVVADVMGRA